MESVKKQEPFQLTLSKKEEKLRRRKKNNCRNQNE